MQMHLAYTKCLSLNGLGWNSPRLRPSRTLTEISTFGEVESWHGMTTGQTYSWQHIIIEIHPIAMLSSATVSRKSMGLSYRIWCTPNIGNVAGWLGVESRIARPNLLVFAPPIVTPSRLNLLSYLQALTHAGENPHRGWHPDLWVQASASSFWMVGTPCPWKCYQQQSQNNQCTSTTPEKFMGAGTGKTTIVRRLFWADNHTMEAGIYFRRRFGRSGTYSFAWHAPRYWRPHVDFLVTRESLRMPTLCTAGRAWINRGLALAPWLVANNVEMSFRSVRMQGWRWKQWQGVQILASLFQAWAKCSPLPDFID